MELKTLKDIQEEFKSDCIAKDFTESIVINKPLAGANAYYLDRLTQEAIKHIKSLIEEVRDINKTIKELNLQFDSEVQPRQIDYRIFLSNKTEKERNFKEQIMKIGSQIHWIKHFFNITDKEIK